MSSFIIGKRNYIIAAGIVAGISSEKRLWLYDEERRSNREKGDLYDDFTDFYKYNYFSVRDQYGDLKTDIDENGYISDFEEAYKAGKNAVIHDPDKLKVYIITLREFFLSSLYQVENEDYSRTMCDLYYQILVELMPLLTNIKPETWGSIEI